MNTKFLGKFIILTIASSFMTSVFAMKRSGAAQSAVEQELTPESLIFLEAFRANPPRTAADVNRELIQAADHGVEAIVIQLLAPENLVRPSQESVNKAFLTAAANLHSGVLRTMTAPQPTRPDQDTIIETYRYLVFTGDSELAQILNDCVPPSVRQEIHTARKDGVRKYYIHQGLRPLDEKGTSPAFRMRQVSSLQASYVKGRASFVDEEHRELADYQRDFGGTSGPGRFRSSPSTGRSYFVRAASAGKQIIAEHFLRFANEHFKMRPEDVERAFAGAVASNKLNMLQFLLTRELGLRLREIFVQRIYQESILNEGVTDETLGLLQSMIPEARLRVLEAAAREAEETRRRWEEEARRRREAAAAAQAPRLATQRIADAAGYAYAADIHHTAHTIVQVDDKTLSLDQAVARTLEQRLRAERKQLVSAPEAITMLEAGIQRVLGKQSPEASGLFSRLRALLSSIGGSSEIRHARNAIFAEWGKLAYQQRVCLALSFLKEFYPDKIDIWIAGFVEESIHAYERGTSTTSCSKGIEERVLTGIRGISDPTLDRLFSKAEGPQLMKSFFSSCNFADETKCKWLVRQLIKGGVTKTSDGDDAAERFDKIVSSQLTTLGLEQSQDFLGQKNTLKETIRDFYDERLKPLLDQTIDEEAAAAAAAAAAVPSHDAHEDEGEGEGDEVCAAAAGSTDTDGAKPRGFFGFFSWVIEHLPPLSGGVEESDDEDEIPAPTTAAAALLAPPAPAIEVKESMMGPADDREEERVLEAVPVFASAGQAIAFDSARRRGLSVADAIAAATGRRPTVAPTQARALAQAPTSETVRTRKLVSYAQFAADHNLFNSPGDGSCLWYTLAYAAIGMGFVIPQILHPLATQIHQAAVAYITENHALGDGDISLEELGLDPDFMAFNTFATMPMLTAALSWFAPHGITAIHVHLHDDMGHETIQIIGNEAAVGPHILHVHLYAQHYFAPLHVPAHPLLDGPAEHAVAAAAAVFPAAPLVASSAASPPASAVSAPPPSSASATAAVGAAFLFGTFLGHSSTP